MFISVILPLVILILYGIVVSLLLLSLVAYHLHLVVNNQSTQEEMKEKYELWGGNPYNRGQYSRQNWNYFSR